MKHDIQEYLEKKGDFTKNRVSYIPSQGNSFGRNKSEISTFVRIIPELMIGSVVFLSLFLFLQLTGLVIFAVLAAWYFRDHRNTARTNGEAQRQQEAAEFHHKIEDRISNQSSQNDKNSGNPILQISKLKEAIEYNGTDSDLFSLYLRPFSSTDKFRYLIDKAASRVRPNEEYKDLERRIAEGMEDIARMYALGQPGEHIGARRIGTAEHEWKLFADELVRLATPIFIVPSTSPGTLWEIERLRESGALPKTIFVMPRWDYLEERDYSDYWQTTSEELWSKLKLKLPKYYKEGAWFRLNEEWDLVNILPDLGGDWEVHQFRLERDDSMKKVLSTVFSNEFKKSVAGYKNIVSHKGWEAFTESHR